MLKKHFGWVPSKPDGRDYAYSCNFNLFLPPSIDLKYNCPVVYDQLDLGSCTANAVSGLVQFLMIKYKLKVYRPARLAIYYWARMLDNTIQEDAGTSLRTAVKVLNKIGTPAEWLWPYDIVKFKEQPDKKTIEYASKHKITQYFKVAQDINSMKNCLAAGFPFVFGFNVYESFMTLDVARTGIMPIPAKNEQLLGGHATECVGYTPEYFIVRNSWGKKWGLKGYFKMPYSLIEDKKFADDFWTFHSINS